MTRRCPAFQPETPDGISSSWTASNATFSASTTISIARNVINCVPRDPLIQRVTLDGGRAVLDRVLLNMTGRMRVAFTSRFIGGSGVITEERDYTVVPHGLAKVEVTRQPVGALADQRLATSVGVRVLSFSQSPVRVFPSRFVLSPR